MAAMNESLLYRLAIALGIGVIVGLERGWQARDERSGQRLAGIRTFSLAGLLGGVLAAADAETDGFALLAAGALAFGALTIAGYLGTGRETHDFGMTTELALLATFALGALAVLRAPLEAAAAGVVMTLLLGFKAEVHHTLRKLERHELVATLQLLGVAIVLVPLLPNRDMGPWDAVNPRVIGLLVLLIAGLSYVGYFAVRVLGARIGLLLTALLGGLSSSTAATVAFARRARAAAGGHALLGAGIALACATMAPRVAVEIAAVNRPLLAALWPTLAVVTAVPALGGIVVALRAARDNAADLELENPLQLKAALTFGLLLSTLFIVAEGLQRWLGPSAIYALAAIAGLFDVDAVSITMAESAARESLPPAAAARAIALAVLVNTGAKAVLAASLGGAPMLKSATAILAAALAAGTVTAVITLV
jgi:uncharacterized membrane protein (DUF4010 family)